MNFNETHQNLLNLVRTPSNTDNIHNILENYENLETLLKNENFEITKKTQLFFENSEDSIKNCENYFNFLENELLFFESFFSQKNFEIFEKIPKNLKNAKKLQKIFALQENLKNLPKTYSEISEKIEKMDFFEILQEKEELESLIETSKKAQFNNFFAEKIENTLNSKLSENLLENFLIFLQEKNGEKISEIFEISKKIPEKIYDNFLSEILDFSREMKIPEFINFYEKIYSFLPEFFIKNFKNEFFEKSTNFFDKISISQLENLEKLNFLPENNFDIFLNVFFDEIYFLDHFELLEKVNFLLEKEIFAKTRENIFLIFYKIYSQKFAFLPKTFVLPENLASFSGHKLKCSAPNQPEMIYLFDHLITEKVKSHLDECIVLSYFSAIEMRALETLKFDSKEMLILDDFREKIKNSEIKDFWKERVLNELDLQITEKTRKK